MKKSFIWIGTVIGAAAFLALLFGVMERRANTMRTISVVGECLTTAPRDKTAITLRVTTLAPTTVASMQAATELASQITQELKQMPVQMQTTQFNSYEKTEWNREEQKSVVLGIETTIAIEVSGNNIEVIEGVLNKFAGATNVYTEDLRTYTSPEVLQPIMDKCLGVAVQNARARADALATGDGMRVGRMVSVTYGTNSDDVARPTNMLMRSKVAAAGVAMDTGGTIVTKDTDVSVSVSAVFEIK
ncbi:MAG: DUF541 domain-containing protein [Alphaproteobacteria bacterium]|nr:DUF541 domain-containing protein [Alphaproteobacteria bacterium]